MGIMSGLGRAIGSRVGIGALGTTAFGLGVASQVGPAARDAAFDVAFDDPNADVAFTGRKIDARFLAGTAIGGPLGTAARISAPSDYNAFIANAPESERRAVQTVTGAGVFGGAGFALGKAAGKGNLAAAGIAGVTGLLGGALGASTGVMSPIPNKDQILAGTGVGAVAGAGIGYGVGKAFGRGKIGATLLAGAGMITGAIAGGAGSSFGSASSLIRNNQQFYSESPYAGRTSGSIASTLNASGDIVLGMHNSRRG